LLHPKSFAFIASFLERKVRLGYCCCIW
jgi:hypothetical protein